MGVDPITVSEKVIRHLVRDEGCRVICLKKAKRPSSYADGISDAPGNPVECDFCAVAPNKPWLFDATEFGLSCGKSYLLPVFDCFDGAPVSQLASTRPDASLEGICATPGSGGHSICRYRWPSWVVICEENDPVKLMSKKERSSDNSAMGLFGRPEYELFHHCGWCGVAMYELREMIDAHLRFYDGGRVKESLSRKSPVQYRRSLGLAAWGSAASSAGGARRWATPEVNGASEEMFSR